MKEWRVELLDKETRQAFEAVIVEAEDWLDARKKAVADDWPLRGPWPSDPLSADIRCTPVVNQNVLTAEPKKARRGR